jgi:hypothetical protein
MTRCQVEIGSAAVKESLNAPALLATMGATSIWRRRWVEQAAHQPGTKDNENDDKKRELL